MTPRSPDAARTSSRGSPTVVPNPQIQRAHSCRCPCGAPAIVPERDPVRFTITPLGGAGRAVGQIVDAIVRDLTLRLP
jgi:hypothetical protein